MVPVHPSRHLITGSAEFALHESALGKILKKILPVRITLIGSFIGARIMTGHLALVIAICAEVIATSALASLQGFSKPLPLLLVALGYIASFYMLSVVVKTIPIGVAYAIWSGMGIVLVTLVSMYLYKQKPDVAAIAGMAMIVMGVVTIQLFSSMKSH